VAEFAFSPRFLQDLAEWEHTASTKDKEALDKTLAAIVQNPALAGRVPIFTIHSRPAIYIVPGPFLFIIA